MKDYMQYYDIDRDRDKINKKIKPIHVTDMSFDLFRKYALVPRNIGYLLVECSDDNKDYTICTKGGAYDCELRQYILDDEDIIVNKKDFNRVLSYLKRHGCKIIKEEKDYY